MDSARIKPITFDPKDPAWRGKLWVRLSTTGGPKVFVIWSRVWKVALLLVLLGWLGLAGAAWGFVKYKRGITQASYLDIAFYPLRHRHYRATLSDHAYALAQKQLAAAKWSAGIANLRTAVANNPANLPARRDLASLYHQLGRMDTAISLLQEGFNQGKTDPEYLRLFFALLERDGRGTQAWELGQSLLPTAPDDDAFHRELATMLVAIGARLGHYEEARALLLKWKLDRAPIGQISLAEIEISTGQRAQGINRLEKLLAENPDYELAGLTLVQLYREDHRIDEARRLALRRVLLRPQSPGARVDFISLLHQTGDLAAYRRERDDFLAQFANDERALALLVATSSQINETMLPKLILGKSAVDADGRKSARLLLACMQAECRAGEYASALETGTALESHPALGVGLVSLNAYRAWASFGLGRTTEGQTWLNQLLNQQGPAFTPNAALLAQQLANLKLKDETRRLRQALVERNPENITFLSTLVSDDLDQQRWDDVRAHLPTLLNLKPKPDELIVRLWQARDFLNLSPDLLQRLQNGAGM
ncbi:MAG: tetratricopeptide repeat protein [Opitutaceae bacterium]|nr:tetratricopeptide repeat protein [Opitutaceae bacterium]